jgi:hypothetical protein
MAVLAEKIQRLVKKGVYRIFFHAEDHGMIGIGRRSLEPIKDEVVKSGDICSHAGYLLFGADGRRLPGQGFKTFGGNPCRRSGQCLGLPSLFSGGLFIEFLRLLLHGVRPIQPAFQFFGIERHIRDRGKQRFHDEMIERFVRCPQLPRPVCVLRNAFYRINQQILQCRRLGRFSADASDGAA